MSVLVVARLLAFLAFLALVLGALAVVGSLRSQRSLRDLIGPQALVVAGVIGLTATMGSLYFSEVAGFPPCRLCWVQRGFMYPLGVGILLAVAYGASARHVARVVIPASLLGASVSTWHWAMQLNPDLSSSVSCSIEVPCTTTWVWLAGFISIPFMALCGFLGIAALSLVAARHARDLAADVPDMSNASDVPGRN